MSWSSGSYLSTRLTLPADPFVATVYEMLAGGLVAYASWTTMRRRREA